MCAANCGLARSCIARGWAGARVKAKAAGGGAPAARAAGRQHLATLFDRAPRFVLHRRQTPLTRPPERSKPLHPPPSPADHHTPSPAAPGVQNQAFACPQNSPTVTSPPPPGKHSSCRPNPLTNPLNPPPPPLNMPYTWIMGECSVGSCGCKGLCLTSYASPSHPPPLSIRHVSCVVAFIAAFGIGANDVANSFASSVGAKGGKVVFTFSTFFHLPPLIDAHASTSHPFFFPAITLPQALIIAVVCEFGGAVLLGAGEFWWWCDMTLTR